MAWKYELGGRWLEAPDPFGDDCELLTDERRWQAGFPGPRRPTVKVEISGSGGFTPAERFSSNRGKRLVEVTIDGDVIEILVDDLLALLELLGRLAPLCQVFGEEDEEEP